MRTGYLYVLYNPSMEGLVKIGTTRRSSEERAAAISRATGVPMAFLVVYEEQVSDCDSAERMLHLKLAHARVNPKREFFRLPIKEAVKALQQVASAFRTQQLPGVRGSTQSVEILPGLQQRYPRYLRPDITSVRLMHRDNLCFLEITSTVYPHSNDEHVERVDLSFIVASNGSMFPPSRTVQQNGRTFVEDLDPYSIIMCTPLFTEAACREVAAQYERHGG